MILQVFLLILILILFLAALNMATCKKDKPFILKGKCVEKCNPGMVLDEYNRCVYLENHFFNRTTFKFYVNQLLTQNELDKQKAFEQQEQERKDFEAQVKAYEAETKRLAQVQASMSPEQIQDIVLGTVHGMITSGDLVSEMPGRDQSEMMPDMMLQQGMMPEQQGMPQ